MIETLAVFNWDDTTFTIEKHSKGYYILRTEKQGSIEVQSTPDLGELIVECIDKSI